LLNWKGARAKLGPYPLYCRNNRILPKDYIALENNADGKCKLEIPANKKWFFLQTQRLVGKKIVNYYWVY
jgi:hypothetical protein